MNRNSVAVSRLVASLALAAAFVAPAAFADVPNQANAIMPVTASIAANCTVDTTPLAFGNYDPIVANGLNGSDLSAVATLGVACTQGSFATITMGEGEMFQGGVRHMVSGQNGGVLAYELFVDGAQSLSWPAEGVGYEGTGLFDTSVKVFGRIPRAQNQPVSADYSDAVNVTISF